MKRAIVFLIGALFIFLVIDPNISSRMSPQTMKTPEYKEDEVLRTNDDVEQQISSSHALIMIDPGRGGRDTGYTSQGQASEKDLAMQLALSIGSKLEKAGYQTAYTRWYDDVPACSSQEECDQARLNKAKEAGADYLLSLRFNQDNSLHRGYSIFTQPDNEQLSDLSKEIAAQIQATSYSVYEGLDTDHYQAFPTLQDPEMPSVLLQIGYITSPVDTAKISDTRFQNRIGNAVAQAFLNTVN